MTLHVGLTTVAVAYLVGWAIASIGHVAWTATAKPPAKPVSLRLWTSGWELVGLILAIAVIAR